MVFRSVCVLLCALSLVAAMSSGPPVGSAQNNEWICRQMIPSPNVGAHGSPGTNSAFSMAISPAMTETATGYTYAPGTQYTLTISGGGIEGFLVQARMPGNTPTALVDAMLLGAFTAAAGQRVLNCDLAAGAALTATISHSQNQGGVTSVSVTWTAPITAGDVNFFFTVVASGPFHYDAINARTTPQPTNPPATDAPTIPPGATDPPTTAPGATDPPTTPPGSVVPPPSRLPDQYRLKLFNPNDCTRRSCLQYIGIDTNTGNDGYLDIYMEGTAEGWLAVGFSASNDMFVADVVACNRVGDSIVAIDGWNPQSRTNNKDTIQDTTLHSSSYIDGRLRCTISKKIAASDSQDLDLDVARFILYSRRSSPHSNLNGLSTHSDGASGSEIRGFSSALFNPSNETASVGGSEFDAVHRPRLIRAHGILMIIAWPMLAFTAILFAALMRPALPNGEWFQVHRALMIISLFITAAAFILIFVALKGSGGLVNTSNRTSLAHMIIGIIIMALQIINPIIAICRCDPGKKYRWIFNMVHGYIIGIIAEILAYVNVSLGLAIFSRTLSATFQSTSAPLWTFVAWDVFSVIIALVIIFGLAIAWSCWKGDDDKYDTKKTQDIELKAPGESQGEDEKPERKKPSRDSKFRWAVMIFYLAVTVPVLLAIIVMVAFP